MISCMVMSKIRNTVYCMYCVQGIIHTPLPKLAAVIKVAIIIIAFCFTKRLSTCHSYMIEAYRSHALSV